MGCGASSVNMYCNFDNVKLLGRTLTTYYYIGANQSIPLKIDLNEVELQEYAQKALNSIESDSDDIKKKIDCIYNFMRNNPELPKNQEESNFHKSSREQYYVGKTEVLLGDIITKKPCCVVCRERAIAAHIILAQIGLPTMLIRTNDHMYLEYTSPKDYAPAQLIIDVQKSTLKINEHNYCCGHIEGTFKIAEPLKLFTPSYQLPYIPPITT